MGVLNDVAMKIERAEEHWAELERAMKGWAEPQKLDIIHYADRETGWHTYRAKPLPEPPGKWVVILGEIAYHLRSALNYLVEGLVVANGSTPTLGNQFPIYSVDGPKTQAGMKQSLAGVANTPWGLIDAIQPYKRPNRRNLDALEVVARAANKDKHHGLHVAGAVMVKPENVRLDLGRSDVTMHELRFANVVGSPVEQAELLSFRITPPDVILDKMHVEGGMTVSIMFTNGARIPGWQIPSVFTSVQGIVDLLTPHL